MNKVLIVLLAGLLSGALAAHAKLPAPPPMSEADKAAKAQDKAVANYKKNHSAMGKK